MSLKSISNRIAKAISATKKKLAPRNTGRLASSIKDFVKVSPDKVTITSKMLEYGYYQDSGISGTKQRVNKNPQSFNPPGKFTGAYKMTGGSLPFGARVSIYQKGFAPQPFIVPSVMKVMDNQGYKLLAGYVSEEVMLEFKKAFE